jgi:hypothetical protein
VGTAALGCPVERKLGFLFAGVTYVAEQSAENSICDSVLKGRGFKPHHKRRRINRGFSR